MGNRIIVNFMQSSTLRVQRDTSRLKYTWTGEIRGETRAPPVFRHEITLRGE